MNSKKIVTPVILAGGVGERLWPSSTRRHPKQFSKIISDKTLFQESVSRFKSNKIIDFTNPIVMTHRDYEGVVLEQLKDISVKPSNILIEPEVKNTAAAILAASLYAQKINPNAILLIAPSDHLLPDNYAFNDCLREGLKFVNKEKIITFGAVPDRPETGYGYLKFSGNKSMRSMELESFIEKPSLDDALLMLESGNFLWNMGIFLFKASVIISSFKSHFPQLLQPVTHAINNGSSENEVLKLDSLSWSKCESISLDYAIMENSTNLIVVPFKGRWSDLGDWNSIWRESEKNNSGLAVSKGSLGIDCKDSLLHSSESSQKIVGIGLDNIVAVSTNDGILVMNKNQSQKVKKALDVMSSSGLHGMEHNTEIICSWGNYQILFDQKYFTVRLIKINQGCHINSNNQDDLIVQWTVLEGKAKVFNEHGFKILLAGDPIDNNGGCMKRIENMESEVLHLIEVRVGKNLNSDKAYED